jgi:hypothetical protein
MKVFVEIVYISVAKKGGEKNPACRTLGLNRGRHPAAKAPADASLYAAGPRRGGSGASRQRWYGVGDFRGWPSWLLGW